MKVSTKYQERTQIDIIKTSQTHTAIFPDLLAGHILSGCDTVPQMYSVGKKTMLKYLKDYPLSKLGEEHQDEEEMIRSRFRHRLIFCDREIPRWGDLALTAPCHLATGFGPLIFR